MRATIMVLKRVWVRAAPIAVLVLVLCASARAEDRYEQRPTRGLSWGNSRITAVADDFVFEERTEVVRIRWWGTYAQAGSSSDLPQDQFTIHIYSDSRGVPDKLLARIRVPDARRELTGEFADGWLSYEYEYSYELPRPFVAGAGRRYWIRIQNEPVSAERSSLPALGANPWSWVFGDPSRNFGVTAALIKRRPAGTLPSASPLTGPWERIESGNAAFALETF
jgi:hypothetical protein